MVVQTTGISFQSPLLLTPDTFSFYGCFRSSNGQNIINPIKSASIRTINSVAINRGKVEVRAKLPTGDWIWPAIWLLPKDNVYGTWPASGEVDFI